MSETRCHPRGARQRSKRDGSLRSLDFPAGETPYLEVLLDLFPGVLVGLALGLPN